MRCHPELGARILEPVPRLRAVAPIVRASHERYDGGGYPKVPPGWRLNLASRICQIADVYDALRSNRVYREGLPSDRIRGIMTQKDSPAFNTRLLRRFINLMGLFPVGTLVRLSTDQIGVVTHEHPTDPFRPQVKILLDGDGQALDDRPLVNTWEANERGEFPHAVVEAVDPDSVKIDPLAYM